MTKEEVSQNLCYYDKRNPYSAYSDLLSDEDIETYKLASQKSCSCDNCFYGRTKLAEHILELSNLSSTFVQNYKTDI